MNTKVEITVEGTTNSGIKSASYDSIALATINIGLQQLRHYKNIGSSSHEAELDWEIKLYEWILAQPDAEKKANEYASARHQETLINKRDAVKSLGWVI